MRFRQSTLKTWMACPLQAKFKHIDKQPGRQNAKASFGTVIHHAMDLYNQTGDVDAAVDDFAFFWHNPENLGVEPEYWPKYTSYGELRERGVEIIRRYHENLKWEGRQVITTEHRFLVPFGRHELEGTMDLLEIRKNHRGKDVLRVLDYKTNTKQPTKGQLAVDIQFTVYTYASLQPEFWMGNGPEFPPITNGEFLFGALAELPRRAIWYALWTGKEIDCGTREDADFMRLYRVCDEIEKAVEKDVYVPSISGEACTICDFANGPCPTKIPERSERAEEEMAWV